MKPVTLLAMLAFGGLALSAGEKEAASVVPRSWGSEPVFGDITTEFPWITKGRIVEVAHYPRTPSTSILYSRDDQWTALTGSVAGISEVLTIERGDAIDTEWLAQRFAPFCAFAMSGGGARLIDRGFKELYARSLGHEVDDASLAKVNEASFPSVSRSSDGLALCFSVLTQCGGLESWTIKIEAKTGRVVSFRCDAIHSCGALRVLSVWG